jgi:hypothetical protein
MVSQKAQELGHVALIGIQRFRGHAALGAEITKPSRDFGIDVGRDAKPVRGGCLGGSHRGKSDIAFFTLP